MSVLLGLYKINENESKNQDLNFRSSFDNKNAYESYEISNSISTKQLRNNNRPKTKSLVKVWDFNISDTIDYHKSRPPRTISKAVVKSQTSIGNGSRQNKYCIKHQKSEGVQYSDFTNEFENWYASNLASDLKDKDQNTTLNFSTSNKSHKIIYNKAPFDPRWKIRREKSKIETSFKRAIASLWGGNLIV